MKARCFCLNKIYTRKIIALAFAGAYLIFTGFCLWTGKELPGPFDLLAGTVIGWYFSQSTARDNPKKDGE